jgi:hypothetical protein
MKFKKTPVISQSEKNDRSRRRDLKERHYQSSHLQRGLNKVTFLWIFDRSFSYHFSETLSIESIGIYIIEKVDISNSMKYTSKKFGEKECEHERYKCRTRRTRPKALIHKLHEEGFSNIIWTTLILTYIAKLSPWIKCV